MEQNKSLQALRCFAFFLIFVSHSGIFGESLGMLGAFGVSVFIIMSGFITGIKHKAKEIRPLDFAKSRLKRIYPLHVATLLCALPFSFVAIKGMSESFLRFFIKVFANLTLTQSFIPFMNYYFSLNAVAWYLSLVVLFALVTKPLLIFAEKYTGGGYFLLLVFFQFAWTFLFAKSSFAHWAIYICPPVRAAEYFFGILCGKNFCKAKKFVFDHFNAIFALTFFGVLILVFLSAALEKSRTWFYSVAWTEVSALLCAVFYLAEFKEGFFLKHVLCAKPFVFIGNISMEMFLMHQIVLRYKDVFVKRGGFFLRCGAAFFCLLICFFCAMTWRFLERKFKAIKWRKKS